MIRYEEELEKQPLETMWFGRRLTQVRVCRGLRGCHIYVSHADGGTSEVPSPTPAFNRCSRTSGASPLKENQCHFPAVEIIFWLEITPQFLPCFPPSSMFFSLFQLLHNNYAALKLVTSSRVPTLQWRQNHREGRAGPTVPVRFLPQYLPGSPARTKNHPD